MASDASMQAELAAFSKILEQNRTFVAVCTGVIVWDTIVTLPLELKHIWRTRLGAVSFFYLFNRYGTVAEMAVACYMGYWVSKHDTVSASSWGFRYRTDLNLAS